MHQKIRSSALFSTVILPLIPMLLWGSLYPLVKIGYVAFSINTDSVADILLFAACRFTICGALVCVLAWAKGDKLAVPAGKSIRNIVFMGFFSIVLHYGAQYIGLSLTDSSKTALLKQLGALLYVCFAFLFIKEEKFSVYKIVGGLVGFAGIVAINFGGGVISFNTGDMLVLVASVCTVAGSIISKNCVKGTSPLWVTGISQFAGGIVLFAVGLGMGGRVPEFTLSSTPVFLYICAASILGYTLFYYVQRTVSNSKLFIIKFADPLFACLFSAVLLGEDILKIQYLVAFILISTGIMLGNKQKEGCV